jgi:hypothetical protein
MEPLQSAAARCGSRMPLPASRAECPARRSSRRTARLVLSRSAVGVLTTIGIPKAGQIPISPTICRAGSSTATGLGSLQQRWPVSWRLTNEADHGTIAMFAQIVAKMRRPIRRIVYDYHHRDRRACLVVLQAGRALHRASDRTTAALPCARGRTAHKTASNYPMVKNGPTSGVGRWGQVFRRTDGDNGAKAACPPRP